MSNNYIKLLNKITLLFAIITISITTANASMAKQRGDYSPSSFNYKIKGTITIRPDRAVIPLTLTVTDTTYVKSLAEIYVAYDKLKLLLKKLDDKIFNFSPGNFYKQGNWHKRYASVSFFSAPEKDQVKTTLSVYLVIRFTDKHSFKQRAEFIASAYDFINSHLTKKNAHPKNTKIETHSIQYIIDDIESYREAIVKELYRRAKLMVELVAKQEKAETRIQKVDFNQTINQNIDHFNKATLSLSADFKFNIIHAKPVKTGKKKQ